MDSHLHVDCWTTPNIILFEIGTALHKQQKNKCKIKTKIGAENSAKSIAILSIARLVNHATTNFEFSFKNSYFTVKSYVKSYERKTVL